MSSDDRPAFFNPWTRDGPVLRGEPHPVTVDAPDLGINSFAEARRTFSDRVQYRLDVSWGACDNSQNLAGRSLLFQCFRKIAVAFLQLFKQPHILDGNYSLISEGRDELDLLVRKRLHLAFTEKKYTGQRIFP